MEINRRTLASMMADDEVASRGAESILKLIKRCCLLFAQLGERSCPA